MRISEQNYQNFNEFVYTIGMTYRSKFPPLVIMPYLLKHIPRLLWKQFRRDYRGAMRAGREAMGSSGLKTAAFRGYEATAHDVFVCTYSKSGTYWMLQIVTQIAGRGAADFDHIHDIVPWPESPTPDMPRLTAPSWETSPMSVRAIKTHAEAQFVPYSPDAKYIVVIRDPKDALVSSFHFSESIMPGISSIGLESWTDAFLEGEVPYGIWAEHVASFWPWRDRPNVRIVTFADMKADLAGVVEQVGELMEANLTPSEVEQVVERSGFAYMKKYEPKFKPAIFNGADVEIIRKGKKGEAAETFTPERVAQIDEVMKAQLHRFGSDFPYDDYF